MKIFEIATSKDSNKEKIENIMTVLSTTSNEKVFSFVEKQLSKPYTEETIMSKESRINKIYSELQNQADSALLDFIETKLKQVELSSRVDKAWDNRNFNSGRMSKYKDPFKTLMIQSGGSLKSKIQLLYYIAKNSDAIPGSIFTNTFSGTIDDIIPERIKQNAAFQDIKNTIFFNDTFRGKGIGPGEFALALFGEKGDIVDDGGDVNIGGVGVEIKDGGGGSIKTGSPNSFRRADELRSRIGKQVGVELDRKNKLHWDKPSEFTDAFNALNQSKRYALSLQYVKDLYPNIETSDQTDLAQGLSTHAGTPAVSAYFGKALLNSYKKQDKWDSILFISKSGALTNLASPDDADKINFSLAGINRDGDTQALPDGYINGSIFKSNIPKDNTTTIRKNVAAKPKALAPASNTSTNKNQQQLQAINSTEDRFLAALADTNNPVSVAWKQIKSELKADAKDYALELMLAGNSDDEVAAKLVADIFEQKRNIKRRV